MKSLKDRLLEGIDRRGPDDCWEWLRYRNHSGYGVIGDKDKVKRASRLMYEFFVGEIPDGYKVCHRCDNPPCCNPSHLFVGTQADNIRDMVRKGRNRASDHRGVLNPSAKLSPSDVRAIRSLYATGSVSQRQIASKYGVTQALVQKVLTFKLWREIPRRIERTPLT